MGRVVDGVVSLLTFNLDDHSSNPAEVYSFFPLKCCLKRRKRGRDLPHHKISFEE